MDTQEQAICQVLFLPPYTWGEKKNVWSELESNPGSLASQATSLTTRPWLLQHAHWTLLCPFLPNFLKPSKDTDAAKPLKTKFASFKKKLQVADGKNFRHLVFFLLRHFSAKKRRRDLVSCFIQIQTRNVEKMPKEKHRLRSKTSDVIFPVTSKMLPSSLSQLDFVFVVLACH